MLKLKDYQDLMMLNKICVRLKVPLKTYFILIAVKDGMEAGEELGSYKLMHLLNMDHVWHFGRAVKAIKALGYMDTKKAYSETLKKYYDVYFLTRQGYELLDFIRKKIEKYTRELNEHKRHRAIFRKDKTFKDVVEKRLLDRL